MSPAKVLLTLCFLQLLFVVSGYPVVRSCLKNYDPKPCVVQWPPPPSGLTLFVLGYGLWFLLVPVLWSFLLMLRANRGPDFRSSISTAELGAGIVITLTLAFIFAHATFIALRLAWGGFVAL